MTTHRPRYAIDVSGLDPLQSEVFLRAVRQAADEGRTVLLSSHIMAEVDRLCQAVTIIKDGRCVESGQLSQLRHLRSSRITCVLPHGTTCLEYPGTTDERGRLVVSVPSEQVPRALQALTQGGATDLTCTPVDLGELFLGHYTAVAR